MLRDSYGAGEYFVGVVSRSSSSRFALRVSAASAKDEMSTHMRVATAIVDNLAIMSNMDPHVRPPESEGGSRRGIDARFDIYYPLWRRCRVQHTRFIGFFSCNLLLLTQYYVPGSCVLPFNKHDNTLHPLDWISEPIFSIARGAKTQRKTVAFGKI